MRVLIVEDDEGIARGLASHLRHLSWAVDMTDSVESAWTALSVEPFDMVLLDLGLRDGDGSEVLRLLRRSPPGKLPDAALPVLIMTARDQVAARIECLDMGADDYVTKPFDPDELAARMRALRRRSVGRAQPLIKTGLLEIDPAARSVHLSGRPVELSTREFGILLALVEVRPRVLSRPQIEAALYNWDSALDSNAVEVHVHHLRKKLGDGVIRTLRGVGYFVPKDVA
ncbi:MAG: response regulator transcription factor [Gammaproteobacteria bacterium]|uniref:response regulator transcription factor n=1 Tax=Rhodoferax sp. TaxID=50421 RepID=UPI001799B1EC|nr:response regulator transcription factor [Rhodoferax sp.]MBU3900681.1 response regulator transcription factor [Gammaproteobacteria bacterium]MBA3058134.1 response regulator transcription factor [Rhodoferax sp.]MBU3998393.1 response regulator transcription factor [Gammaproteobacteria bacterium]MBU4081339.1 response regulator transcription factor [Gammaproteobacteria bacterium]MBU4114527.1 response regulator transcription factor [Gammaproteobacteria bacterium]